MINDQAIYWGAGFLVIYMLAQLLVSYHPRFAGFSAIKKSISVKAITLVVFILAFAVQRLLVSA